MSGGGKGGSQQTTAEIPAWAESAMKENLGRAKDMAQIGYMPYYGPDVAAFTPMQKVGMQSSYDAASAYGLAPQGANPMWGMPQPTTYDNGMVGYSSGDLFEQARAEFEARNPAQAQQYNDLFASYGTQETNPAYQQPVQPGSIPYVDENGVQRYFTLPWGQGINPSSF